MTRKDQRFLSFSALAAALLLTLPFLDQSNLNETTAPDISLQYTSAESSVSTVESLVAEEVCTPEAPIIQYIIMEENDNVVIYDVGNREIIEVIAVNLAILPESDRNLLRRGIPVYSTSQLTTLLCGFCD